MPIKRGKSVSRVFFEVDSDLHREIKNSAFDNDVTMRDWLEQAVREKLKREDKDRV